MANLLASPVYISNQDVIDSSSVSGIGADTSLIDKLIVQSQYIIDDYIRSYGEPYVDGQAFVFPVEDSQGNSLIPDDIKVATLYIVEYLYQRQDIYQNSIDTRVSSESVLSHSVSYDTKGLDVEDILLPDTAKTILNRYRLNIF